MKLYSNGCSYTWGGTLFNFDYFDEGGNHVWLPNAEGTEIDKKRLETVYPHHLGKLLNASEVINQSMGGGSNDRIVRTTLDYFINAKLRGEDLTDYFVTIQWTDPSRTEIYDQNFDDGYIGLLNGNVFSENGRNNSYIHHEKLQKLYYKHFNNSKDDYTRLIKNIYSLGYFLKYHNIPHIFISLGQLFIPWINAQATSEDHWVKLLDHYHSVVKDFTWLYNDANQALSVCVNFENCMPKGSHPSEEGHRQIANALYNYIVEKKLTEK